MGQQVVWQNTSSAVHNVVGQRVLPAFAGMKVLWSPRLMSAATSLLGLGCFLRVSCEVLAYQGYVSWAWKALPVSAVTELAAVTAFAANIIHEFRAAVFSAAHRACSCKAKRLRLVKNLCSAVLRRAVSRRLHDLVRCGTQSRSLSP